MNHRCALFLGLAIGPLCLVAAAEGMPALRGAAATDFLKQEGLYNSLAEAVQAAMYGARPDGTGFAAPNPRHEFVARFSEAGLDVDGPGWRSSWRLRSVGYGDRQVPVGAGRLDADSTRIELQRGAGVTEWYVNSARGLEQGVTLARPPGQRRGERLRLTMDVAGDLQAREAGEGMELVRADGTVALRYEHLVVKDAQDRTLAARMGVAEGAVWVEMEDAGAAWPVTVDPTFVEQARLHTNLAGLFGYSVAVSGDTVVVGDPSESSNATGVDGNPANSSAQSSGAAYVFVRNGDDSWSQQAYLKASNTGTYDNFGSSVAVSGNTAVVGAPGEDGGIPALNGDQNDGSAGQAGAVYIFVRNGVTWSQQAYLKASNPGGSRGDAENGDQFGLSVAVSGDTLVAGAFGEDSNALGVNGNQNNDLARDSGAAYVFGRSGVTWSQQAYLKASNSGASDYFGYSVAVSGDTVAVGAYGEDGSSAGVNGDPTNNGSEGSGAAYVFVRNGDTWSQQAYLKASNPGAEDSFGYSVAVSGDTLVVGAAYEDSNSTGVNGNQANNSFSNSGAAYVFVRSGVTWSQQAYLKAFDTETDDYFGRSVAVSGNTVVVGAPGEFLYTSVTRFGTGYVFLRHGATWYEDEYLADLATRDPRTRDLYGASDLWGFGASVAVSGGTVVVGTVYVQNEQNYPPSAYVFHDPPARITDVRSITDFGDVPGFTSGSWLQITGVNLADKTRVWQASDFTGNNAPVNLDNVSVLFNGRLGFVSFTKPDDEFGPSQINVQTPADLGDGPVNVQVLNHFAVSNIFTIQKTALAPGMLSPPKFNVGGKAYLAATYNADYVFVGNENLATGAPFRPAKPGDSIWTYGVGFGDVTPNIPPGVIPTVATQLNAQVQFQFGPALVTPYYAGLYPGFLGLYLFALVVPDVPDGDHQITVRVNGQPLAQTLYLTVKR